MKIEEGPVLPQIRIEVTGNIDRIMRNIIEPIISATENYCCFFEKQMISAEEKEKMFDLYKELQYLFWSSNKIAIDFSEKEFEKWLVEVKETFDRVKPELSEICEKLAFGWKKYKKREQETTYHG